MNRTLTFQFEELPLVIDRGFEAGDIAGVAEISYHRDGEWTIGAIALDGARRLQTRPTIRSPPRMPGAHSRIRTQARHPR